MVQNRNAPIEHSCRFRIANAPNVISQHAAMIGHFSIKQEARIWPSVQYSSDRPRTLRSSRQIIMLSKQLIKAICWDGLLPAVSVACSLIVRFLSPNHFLPQFVAFFFDSGHPVADPYHARRPRVTKTIQRSASDHPTARSWFGDRHLAACRNHVCSGHSCARCAPLSLVNWTLGPLCPIGVRGDHSASRQ